MWVFLSSEVLFFGSLIATFLVYRNRSAYCGDNPCQKLLNLPLTGVNTFILIVSSLTMVLSLAAAINNRQRQLKLWLLATIVLGSTFLSIQGFEYVKLWNEGLTPRVSLFGSAFYTLTGFHGTHVLVGVIILLAVLLKALFGGFGAKHYLPIELAGLYWHFVDLVWIIIFTLVYLF
jgi:cytochrome c oxidase subunit 3/cytochrome o ubiquinol oxidase subunit 3